jgi:hypothetical protein
MATAQTEAESNGADVYISWWPYLSPPVIISHKPENRVKKIIAASGDNLC